MYGWHSVGWELTVDVLVPPLCIYLRMFMNFLHSLLAVPQLESGSVLQFDDAISTCMAVCFWALPCSF